MTKRFNGFLAVDEVSFEARAGEIFGLLGPNGAGKTTTIRLISTILSPTSGTARICSHDIRHEPEMVRRFIGMLTTEM
ncbi:MAG: ATP-binding cassette domain-containing protein, partial [Actinobacteria bacterium]|nr:ATP-binding cassette domain-containing protein [Actinomycetota bacterium]